MRRTPTTLLACPECFALLNLRGDAIVAQVSRVEGDVLEAARALALATSDDEKALAVLRDASMRLLDLDLATDHLGTVEREINDWLPTLAEHEGLVFAVVALRGLLKRSPRPSLRTLEDAYEGAVSAVADYQREVKRLEYGAERDAWIREHGSRRLKLILAEGYAAGSDAAYRDERLRKDRPGWGWLEAKGRRLGVLNEPRNPPMAAFSVLEEARKLDSDSSLKYLVTRGPSIRLTGHRYVAV